MNRRDFLKLGLAFTGVSTLLTAGHLIENLTAMLAGKFIGEKASLDTFLKEINSDTPSNSYDTYRELTDLLLNSENNSADVITTVFGMRRSRLERPFSRKDLLNQAKTALEFEGGIGNTVNFIFEKKNPEGSEYSGTLINITFLVGDNNKKDSLYQAVNISLTELINEEEFGDTYQIGLIKYTNNGEQVLKSTSQQKYSDRVEKGKKVKTDKTITIETTEAENYIVNIAYREVTDLSQSSTDEIMEYIKSLLSN